MPFWSQALSRHVTCCLLDEELLLCHLDVLVSFTSVDCFSSRVRLTVLLLAGAHRDAVPEQQGWAPRRSLQQSRGFASSDSAKHLFAGVPGIGRCWCLQAREALGVHVALFVMPSPRDPGH